MALAKLFLDLSVVFNCLTSFLPKIYNRFFLFFFDKIAVCFIICDTKLSFVMVQNDYTLYIREQSREIQKECISFFCK